MAEKEAKAGSASPTPAEDKSKAAKASKDLDKSRGKAKTASEAEAEAMDAKNEELPPLSIEELSKRTRASEDRLRSPLSADPNPMFDLTVKVNKKEAAEINRLLAKLRDEAKVEAGEKPRKAYLVNDTGSDRVRWGGVSYRVPEGRNELTDEFVAEHFPDGVTREDLEKGLLGGRVKVEYDEAKPDGAKAEKSTRKSKKATARKK